MQNINETIKRLQALASSDNAHEAAAAARIAEKLKAKQKATRKRSPRARLQEPPMMGRFKTVRRAGVRTMVFAGENPLEYSPGTDTRIVEVIDGKLIVKTQQDAEFLASEMRAFGVNEARALGCAVVFWS